LTRFHPLVRILSGILESESYCSDSAAHPWNPYIVTWRFLQAARLKAQTGHGRTIRQRDSKRRPPFSGAGVFDIAHTVKIQLDVTSKSSKGLAKAKGDYIMSQTVAERTAGHIAESAHQASRATSAIADAIEDGVGVVKRAAKQSGDAAEEFLNDTSGRLQRHLLLSIATTFVVGVAAGTLLSWTIRRR
jgi:hypothetical protein